MLKGPQGTLFGRNTTGGAVLLVPQHPTANLEGYADGTLGDYGEHRLQAALNVPSAGDMVLARLALDVNHRDGFTQDAVTGRTYDDLNYQAYRFGLTVKLSDSIENYFLADYSKDHSNDAGTVLLAVKPGGLAVRRFPGLAGVWRSNSPWAPERCNTTCRPVCQKTAASGSPTLRRSSFRRT